MHFAICANIMHCVSLLLSQLNVCIEQINIFFFLLFSSFFSLFYFCNERNCVSAARFTCTCITLFLFYLVAMCLCIFYIKYVYVLCTATLKWYLNIDCLVSVPMQFSSTLMTLRKVQSIWLSHLPLSLRHFVFKWWCLRVYVSVCVSECESHVFCIAWLCLAWCLETTISQKYNVITLCCENGNYF